MRFIRLWLVFVFAVGMVAPGMAYAAPKKAKTKIVYVQAPRYGFGPEWGFTTKAVKAPVAKARLMVYRSSSKKWVGYGGKTVTIKRGDFPYKRYVVGTRKTDSKGYFSFKMSHAEKYTATYRGGKYAKASSKSASRYDNIRVETLTEVTKETVDSANTRITITTDYRYNPHFSDQVELWQDVWTVDEEDEVLEEIFSTMSPNLVRPLSGHGRSVVSFVAPTALVESQHMAVYTEVRYPGRKLHTTQDDGEAATFF